MVWPRGSGDRPRSWLRCIAGISALLGHKDVRTTMIYTHVVNRGALGALSPLDRLGLNAAGR